MERQALEALFARYFPFCCVVCQFFVIFVCVNLNDVNDK